MKKWVPIMIAGAFVLLLNLPTYFLKRHVEGEIKALSDRDPLWLQKAMNSQLSTKKVPGLAVEPYVDSSAGFRIFFPQNWEVRPPLAVDDILIKAVRKGADNLSAALNIYAWELDDNTRFLHMTGSQAFEQTYKDQAELLESGETTIRGVRAIWMKLKMTNAPWLTYSITYILNHDRRLFSLHGVTVGGNYAWFEENEPAFQGSIRTFQFTE